MATRWNVRTATLKKYIPDAKIRLTEKDREFLFDLSKTGIVDQKDAEKYHYSEYSTKATDRLDHLCKSGVLECVTTHQKGRGLFKSYIFKTSQIAHLFKGRRLEIGGKRNALHEVITSKIYFAEGRPESFKIESRLTKDEKDSFKDNVGAESLVDACLPDAIFYRDDGSMVAVESDAGNYTKSQIQSKQIAWKGIQQVWGQPTKVNCRVMGSKVHRFH